MIKFYISQLTYESELSEDHGPKGLRYTLHKALWVAFDEKIDGRAPYLFRIESIRTDRDRKKVITKVTVQSKEKPSWIRVKNIQVDDCREISFDPNRSNLFKFKISCALRENFERDGRQKQRLIMNPNIAMKRFMEVSRNKGLEIQTIDGVYRKERISGRGGKDGKGFYLPTHIFHGSLKIECIEQAKKALFAQGIGRSKYMGLGMLSISR